MLRNNGAYNGQQIVSAAAIADIRSNDKAGYSQLPGWSYRKSPCAVRHDK
ncbi:hypothetical protein [Craterilacuibacter sp.]